MCGIVGYIGSGPAQPVLMQGLARLEYRGYDSAGIAVLNGNQARIARAPGRLEDLKAKLAGMENGGLLGSVGIAHTRWATHGGPTEANAHPHRVGGVTLVHNGIVENAHEAKEALLKEGAVFSSETDTEVIVHRIARAYRGNAREAIRTALDGLRGTWALAILFDDHPGALYALRKDSPLYLGIGNGETIAASDLSAMPEDTKHYILPEEGEIAMLTKDGVRVWNEDDEEITAKKPILPILVRVADAALGTFPHFMRKEIAEEPGVLAGLIGPVIQNGATEIYKDVLPDLTFVRGIHLVGCGSAMHAGMIGAQYIERFARIPVRVHVASEFRYADPILNNDDLVIVISQSGETADSLAALRLAKSRGIMTVAIVNVPGSTMTREAGSVLYLHAGPEIAVATTKAFSAQVAVLAMLAVRLGADRGRDVSRLCEDLEHLPAACKAVEALFPRLGELAKEFKDSEHCFFIGRGLDYALSMEGALKLKEISYIHCEAYPAGELKHGTISLITRGTPCLVAATDSALYEKTLSGAKEVRARGAKVLMLVKEGDSVPEDVCDFLLPLPHAAEWLMPFVAVIALQFFAYRVALELGCDVDKPRNLAKSVTVE